MGPNHLEQNRDCAVQGFLLWSVVAVLVEIDGVAAVAVDAVAGYRVQEKGEGLECVVVACMGLELVSCSCAGGTSQLQTGGVQERAVVGVDSGYVRDRIGQLPHRRGIECSCCVEQLESCVTRYCCANAPCL
jgi:hypothetical protein